MYYVTCTDHTSILATLFPHQGALLVGRVDLRFIGVYLRFIGVYLRFIFRVALLLSSQEVGPVKRRVVITPLNVINVDGKRVNVDGKGVNVDGKGVNVD
eukprot:426957-Prorocentrum_minimum.AAC.1